MLHSLDMDSRIISYLRICKAPLTELAIQRRSQHGSPKEIRMSPDNKGKRVMFSMPNSRVSQVTTGGWL